jgi:hypothetical protein
LRSPFEELIISNNKKTLRRFMVDKFQDIVNKPNHSKEQEGGMDEDV